MENRTIELFKRNAQGNPICWKCVEQKTRLIISTGIVGKIQHTDIVERKRVKKNEFDARVAEKRKQGYKEVSELYDNAPDIKTLIKQSGLIEYLNTYLPKYNTTDKGFVFPMLAKILEDNKPFEKYEYWGQWKINGVRCIIKAERNDMDLFKKVRFRYFSREGTEWTNMNWFDDIILNNIYPSLLDILVEENAALDGELYLPGYSVNDINSFVKNNTLPQHYKLQYWCYDLCWDDMSYDMRKTYRQKGFKNDTTLILNKEEHLNNKLQLVILPDLIIRNINDAIYYRDRFITTGFEGLIIRNKDASYQFGKRNMSMMKFKKILDGKFKIINIIPEGVRTYLPKFVLMNDINDEMFEATINLPQNNQREILDTKDNFIGRQVLVEYRERSGVKQVPFHAKIIKFIENG